MKILVNKGELFINSIEGKLRKRKLTCTENSPFRIIHVERWYDGVLEALPDCRRTTGLLPSHAR